jgi:hypothetical protein
MFWLSYLISFIAGIAAWVITESLIVVLVVAVAVQILVRIYLLSSRKRDDGSSDS